jgi:MoaA/NifB/PqqE/SkfB family radical SAM enzyme
MERVRQMVGLRRDAASEYPRIHIAFVAMRRNIEQLPGMVDLVSELGADNLTVQYMIVHGDDVREESLFYHQDIANRMLDAAEERAREVGLPVDLPPRFGAELGGAPQRCTDPWEVAFVRWDGSVQPCCHAPGTVVMGGLADQSFWDIWNGPAWRDLRRRVNSASPPSYCLKCTAGRMWGVDDERAHLLLSAE